MNLPAFPAPPGCHWVPIVARHVTHHARRFIHRVVGVHRHHVAHHVVRHAAAPAWRLVCRGAAISGGLLLPPVAVMPPVEFPPAYAAPAPQIVAGGPDYSGYGWPGGGFGGGNFLGGAPVTYPNIVGGLFTPGAVGLPTVPLLEQPSISPRLIETPTSPPIITPPPIYVTQGPPPAGLPQDVPEPGPLAVMLSGLGCLAIVRSCARSKA